MTISEGTYRIRNAKSGTIFDLSKKVGHDVHGWKQHDKNNQHWYVQRSGDGYHFKNVETGQFVGVSGNHNGSKLHGSGNATTWDLRPDGNEHFVFVKGTDFVADLDMGRADDGTPIHLWDKTGAKQQKWSFEKINDNSGGGGGGGYQPPPQQSYQPPPQQQQQQPPPQQQAPPEQQPTQQQPAPQQPTQEAYSGPVAAGTYILKNVKTGTVIDLSGGHADEGAAIFGYEHNGGNNQKWQVQPTGHGQNVTLQNCGSKSYASFSGQSFAQGVILKGSSTPEEYTITQADKGFYVSPTQQPSYVLDLVHGSDKNGTEVCVWENKQQDNQKWYFESA